MLNKFGMKPYETSEHETSKDEKHSNAQKQKLGTKYRSDMREKVENL